MIEELNSIINVLYNEQTKASKEISLYIFNNYESRKNILGLDIQDDRYFVLRDLLTEHKYIIITGTAEKPTYSLTGKAIVLKEMGGLPNSLTGLLN